MIHTHRSIDLSKYQTADGVAPLDEWLATLRDSRARNQVALRMDRLSLGLEGRWRSVGHGIREMKISTGKGYRIYYAWLGTDTIVLLCGGDKRSQRADIKRAIAYWHDHESNP